MLDNKINKKKKKIIFPFLSKSSGRQQRTSVNLDDIFIDLNWANHVTFFNTGKFGVK